ncbi:hypothetical protein [Flavobacterium sp. LAR06]|uniref:hypothetical protein n=1 Tax=Flavobacterium sp. LAR06 TaxID=3064897 RepID=UPI0035BF7C17
MISRMSIHIQPKEVCPKNHDTTFSLYKDIYRLSERSPIYCILNEGGEGRVVKKKDTSSLNIKKWRSIKNTLHGKYQVWKKFTGVNLSNKNIEILINNPILKTRLNYNDNRATIDKKIHSQL